MKMSLATRNSSLQIFFKCPTPAIIFETATKPSGAETLAPARQNGVWPKAVSEHAVFLPFWLRCVLRATPVCTSQNFNSQKWSETEGFWPFWLQNLLRATAVCNFWFLIWPDGSAPTTLASLLFNPPERQNIGKTQCFATFLPFRTPGSYFFSLFLFSDLLSSAPSFWLFPPLLFHLSIL